jgi:hypothetical protein
MTTEVSEKGQSDNSRNDGMKRRMVLGIGAVVAAITGASTLSSLTASRAEAAVQSPPGVMTTPVPTATTDLSATIATLAADRSHTITNPALAKAPRAVLLQIPTYDGSGVVVHPSVYFNPGGWSGYKYWMAMTPYASANAALENPSIVVSHDGNTWTVPAGLTNPLEPAPPGAPASGYNSDPFLTVANDGKMYLFWRTFDGQEKISYRTSTDGITWTPKALSRLADPTVDRLASPSIAQQPDGTWVMHAVNILPSPRRIVRTTAPAPQGPWSPVQTCTVTGNTGNPWHIDVHKVGGEWQALVVDGGSGGGDLWAAVSNDGLNFTAGPNFISRLSGQWDSVFYKSCFVPAVKDGLAGWDAWIGSGSFAATGNIMGRTFVRFDSLNTGMQSLIAELAVARGETSVLQAINGLSPWIVGDSFSRADNAALLGTANTGQVWATASGSWKVAGKAAQPQSAGNNIATIETATADHWVTVAITYPATTGTRCVVARYSDNSNFYRYGIFAGVLALQKVVAGVATTISTPTGTITSGMSIGIRCSGSTIDLYLNHLLVATVRDTALAAGTKAGIQDNSATSRYDTFTARTA